MAVEYLDNGNGDGTVFGTTSGKIAFYGGTPAEKPTLTLVTASSSITIADVLTDLASIRTALYTLGLCTSG